MLGARRGDEDNEFAAVGDGWNVKVGEDEHFKYDAGVKGSIGANWGVLSTTSDGAVNVDDILLKDEEAKLVEISDADIGAEGLFFNSNDERDRYDKTGVNLELLE